MSALVGDKVLVTPAQWAKIREDAVEAEPYGPQAIWGVPVVVIHPGEPVEVSETQMAVNFDGAIYVFDKELLQPPKIEPLALLPDRYPLVRDPYYRILGTC